ncbi:hypothetical protein JRQ81_015294 [Phrynocephalus forsythii]|uniref:Uncharacterized protein n=1 Tax=Phrynocephalus forsythii TaxID=171643 RepID=A0A9Q1B1M2_9SAUR|nr:hypothetical protein JRQ81_015294 [Phrynocephalus forsythii]
MEVLESGEPNLLHWDRKLSELSEPGDSDALLYNTDQWLSIPERVQRVLVEFDFPFIAHLGLRVIISTS